MKAKLLKKLRKLFVIESRNNLYRVFENRQCLGGIYNYTNWNDFKTTKEKQRDLILNEASKYLTAKKVLV